MEFDMEPQFSTVELGEVQIHYAEVPGHGPALVLLHGILGSHLSFLPLLPDLAAGAHVYALDLRGHGWSSHVPGKCAPCHALKE
jgi:pimeloyl-ACP methyl ester carboxylesterase